ncbi:hypothetical protein RIEGSTA812A_PEG_746 [invertebrate metagenome]|uniref:DUF302 domain-containing protein n=1 Tax=invertebrate metagenome TaxID=1711999 RepID=A0A484H8Y5_9ZZZZ
MRFIRNILAITGMATIILGVGGYIKIRSTIERDPWMIPTYLAFTERLLQTANPGDAMVLAVPVKAELSLNDVKESMRSLANARNLLFVGEATLHKQIEAVTGLPSQHISLMSFCDARVGKRMADYNSVYTAFMPCRVAIVQDRKGALQLYTMRLDMMIHGGKPLPSELYKETSRVWYVLQEIMHGAASGNF